MTDSSAPREPPSTSARTRGRLEHVLRQDAHEGVRVEGHLPGEHLVHDHAERVDVGALVDGLPRRLLGRHVVRRAEDHPGLGELARAAADLGHAEVEHLHEARVVPLLDDEDVVRLQVAVDDAARVGRVERGGDLADQMWMASFIGTEPPRLITSESEMPSRYSITK